MTEEPPPPYASDAKAPADASSQSAPDTGAQLPFPNEANVRRYLKEHKVPEPMHDLVLRNLHNIACRFVIIDNSGSMAAEDGQRLVKTDFACVAQPCSRWRELTENLTFQAGLLRESRLPCEFRIINDFSPMVFGISESADKNALSRLLAAFETSPSGATPLCRHIQAVADRISDMHATHVHGGKKFVLVICTDGEATDGDLAAAMKPLERLPVSVVVRLCTNNDSVVSYWNNIDQQLELDMDVLDDLFSEAGEVQAANPWLNYNEHLHHLRLLGGCSKEFDVLDEKLLTADQLRAFLSSLLGVPRNELPHPADNWGAFSAAIAGATERSGFVFSPTALARKPIVDVPLLARAYSKFSGAPPLQRGLTTMDIIAILIVVVLVLRWIFK